MIPPQGNVQAERQLLQRESPGFMNELFETNPGLAIV
jgi:hypothetical protein